MKLGCGCRIGVRQAREGTGIIETFNALFKASILHSASLASHHEIRKHKEAIGKANDELPMEHVRDGHDLGAGSAHLRFFIHTLGHIGVRRENMEL